MNTLTVLLLATAAARAQDLTFPEQCAAVPVLNTEVCGAYTVDTCGDTVAVRATYDGDEVADFNVSLSDARYCTNEEEACHQCFDFRSLVVRPGYVEACPRVTNTDCVGGIDIPVNLQCFELGEECAGAGCYECAQQDRCGWCASGGGSCVAVDSSGERPYCGADTCAGGAFTVSSVACDDAPDDSGSSGRGGGAPEGGGGGGGGSSTGLAVGVSVAVFAGLALVAAAVLYSRRKRRAPGEDTQFDHQPLADTTA